LIMALSIKTAEADRLARDLTRLTGETITEAVTEALRERLARKRADWKPDPAELERLMAFAREASTHFDKRPVTKAEWDWACGDEA
jgi:antitoxin VapB